MTVPKKPAHVAPMKKEAVQKINSMLKNYSTVGIAKITGIPGPQMQKIRQKLRGRVELIVSKNTLFELAIKDSEKAKPGIKGLNEKISSQMALVATNLNPFTLFKEMERTKMPSAAKGGEVAPDDIQVSEGETSFKPGPIVGELQKAGIPAGIEGGKVLIKKDKLLVKKGDRIPKDLAPMLSKLEIFPLVVGLDLQAAWEAGTIYPANVLSIDEVKILGDMNNAARFAFNLAMFSAYPNTITMKPLLAKARLEAIAVALEAGVATKDKDVMGMLLAKGTAQAKSLKAAAKLA
jgi:large subunit ribosomal protein L10